MPRGLLVFYATFRVPLKHPTGSLDLRPKQILARGCFEECLQACSNHSAGRCLVRPLLEILEDAHGTLEALSPIRGEGRMLLILFSEAR